MTTVREQEQSTNDKTNQIIGYPELEGDESRRAIWLYDVPLGAAHHLRHALNNRKGDYFEVLQKYEIPVVASVLKLYLLELPGKSPGPILL